MPEETDRLKRVRDIRRVFDSFRGLTTDSRVAVELTKVYFQTQMVEDFVSRIVKAAIHQAVTEFPEREA